MTSKHLRIIFKEPFKYPNTGQGTLRYGGKGALRDTFRPTQLTFALVGVILAPSLVFRMWQKTAARSAAKFGTAICISILLIVALPGCLLSFLHIGMLSHLLYAPSEV